MLERKWREKKKKGEKKKAQATVIAQFMLVTKAKNRISVLPVGGQGFCSLICLLTTQTIPDIIATKLNGLYLCNEFKF